MVKMGGFWVPEECPYFTQALQQTGGYVGEGTIAKALSHVKHFRCAVDVGAHIGTWTRPLAGKFDRVLAFEASPAMYRYFLANTGEIGNVTSWPLALGAETRLMGMSSEGTMNSGQGYVVPANGSLCPVLTLDFFELDDVGLLKIDTEGMELPVLEGALNTIQKCRPVIVIEENSCSQRYDIEIDSARTYLEDADYVEAERVEFAPANFDVIMVPKENR